MSLKNLKSPVVWGNIKLEFIQNDATSLNYLKITTDKNFIICSLNNNGRLCSKVSILLATILALHRCCPYRIHNRCNNVICNDFCGIIW